MSDTNHILGDPTSTTRLESEGQFERLGQKIDTKINEGLTTSLTQFESRLEATLENIRQTVTTSLSARSQVVTDQEREVECDNRTTSAPSIHQMADEGNQGDELDLDPSHVRDNGQVTDPTWFGSQTSFREQTVNGVYMANSHMVKGMCLSNPPGNVHKSDSHMVT